jgi:hypothetical protein
MQTEATERNAEMRDAELDEELAGMRPARRQSRNAAIEAMKEKFDQEVERI